MKKLVLGILIVGVFLWATSSMAMLCSTNDLTGSVNCDEGNKKNDKWSAVHQQVNDDTMFGDTDWEFLEKVVDSEEIVDIGLSYTITPGTDNRQGTWSIDDWLKPDGMTQYEDLMMVLKGGTGYYAGYLLDNIMKVTSGNWDTDVVLDAGISHISIYGRGESPLNPVPEPATLLLLGAGLVGLAGVTRKKIFKKA